MPHVVGTRKWPIETNSLDVGVEASDLDFEDSTYGERPVEVSSLCRILALSFTGDACFSLFHLIGMIWEFFLKGFVFSSVA